MVADVEYVIHQGTVDDEYSPDIDGNTAVYEVSCSAGSARPACAFGGRKTCYYRFDLAREICIETAGNQTNPRIDGNHIVFVDDSGINYDVGVWDIGLGMAYKLQGYSSGSQTAPVINDGKIAYADNGVVVDWCSGSKGGVVLDLGGLFDCGPESYWLFGPAGYRANAKYDAVYNEAYQIPIDFVVVGQVFCIWNGYFQPREGWVPPVDNGVVLNGLSVVVDGGDLNVGSGSYLLKRRAPGLTGGFQVVLPPDPSLGGIKVGVVALGDNVTLTEIAE